MKRPEILSPVGNMDNLYAAIEAGCDAVYLAGKAFGARSYAGNFSNDEIIKAIDICHEYGIKVYVTINTMINENDFDDVIKFVSFLHENNVDALIIQDLGLLDYILHVFPNLEVHASTQMHIHNLEGAKLLQKIGVKRVVLARETPIELIKEIKENTNLEIEIFVHGALCVSYSGECYFSYFLGGRSGNKGSCAQCCRMPYNLENNGKILNKDKYLLSTKDLNTLDYLDKLIDIGVDSLKIEGRMKSKEYVYLVTSLYKNAVDNYLINNKISYDKNILEKLKIVFNRDYTKGFIFNEDNNNFTNEFRPNHKGIEIGKVIDVNHKYAKILLNKEVNNGDGIRFIGKEKDYGMIINGYKKITDNIISVEIKDKVAIDSIVYKTSSITLKKEIENIIDKHERKVIINGKIKCHLNKPISLEISDGRNNINVLSNNICEKATNRPITKEDIKKQINKTGNTIYQFNNIDIELDDNIFVNIKYLNDIRRNALELLKEKRLYKSKYLEKTYDVKVNKINYDSGYSYVINNISDISKINKNNLCNMITNNIDIYNKLKNKYQIYYRIPRVIEHHINYDIPLYIGELGSINKYNDIISDFGLNISNSYAIAFLHNLGVKRVTLSVELKEDDIKLIINNFKNRYGIYPNTEVIVSFYPEIMINKYNLLNKYHVNEGYLIDHQNNKYRVINDNDFMKIYFYKKIEIDNYHKLFNYHVSVLRIEI